MNSFVAIVLKINGQTEVWYPDWTDEELSDLLERNQTNGASVAGDDEQVIDDLRQTLESWSYLKENGLLDEEE